MLIFNSPKHFLPNNNTIPTRCDPIKHGNNLWVLHLGPKSPISPLYWRNRYGSELLSSVRTTNHVRKGCQLLVEVLQISSLPYFIVDTYRSSFAYQTFNFFSPLSIYELDDLLQGSTSTGRGSSKIVEPKRKMKMKNFRKREREYEGEDQVIKNNASDDEEERRLVLEEVKFLQKQREKKSGIPATTTTVQAAVVASSGGGLVPKKVSEKNEGDGEKDELVLQDTFAQETAVMVEDPNMLRYVEQELAKKRGKNIVANHAENEIKHAEDELYKIPEHLKVKRRNSEESSTQWTTGIAEVQLPIEYKLRNIEETEAAKKLLQEKRLTGRIKTESSIPASYSADYFQRGRDYAEKLRREHPELYKERGGAEDNGLESKPSDSGTDAAGRRQAATDEFMLERFRKRERHRVMRR